MLKTLAHLQEGGCLLHLQCLCKQSKPFFCAAAGRGTTSRLCLVKTCLRQAEHARVRVLDEKPEVPSLDV